MSEEEFRKIAKEYAEMYFTKGIDSAKIFNYVGELEMKVEQLENIRKEVIEYIKDNACYSEGHCKCSFSQMALDNLLNILNKGSASND